MTRLTQIQQLRKQGLTLVEIGLKFGISKQRVEQILNPAYIRAYQKTPKFRVYQTAYQNHVYHLKVSKKFLNCERCKNA